MGFSKSLFFAAGFLSFGPSSLYNFIPSFCKPPLRFVMYTNCCCSVSCVSSVDLLSSVSQLNSSIEIFSQVPVCSVESTCSSSSFGFCIFLTFPCNMILHEALFPESLSNFLSTSSLFCFLHFQPLAYLFQAYFCSPS